MALKLTTDIALDVMRAADPARVNAAKARLSALAAGSPQAAAAAGHAWEATVAQSSSPAAQPRAVFSQLPLGTAGLSFGSSPASRSTSATAVSVTPNEKDPAVQFEAFVLQSFVESMLPKDAESVFGKGVAGSTWRSMLAEKLANEIAKSGGIGIAASLNKGEGSTRALKDGRDGA